MSKWESKETNGGRCKVYQSGDNGFMTYAYGGEADTLITAHNADVDAYEARIAELEADIASAMKFAKLAIEHLPACDYITDIDGIEKISTVVILLCHALSGGNCDEEE